MRILKPLILILVLLLCCTAAQAQAVYDLQADNIRADTEYLSNVIGVRVTGTPKEREAADWIMQRLGSMGYSEAEGTLSRVGFQGLKNLTSENIIAAINPNAGLPLFSIVAHYDSVATTLGARDNAASIAILLEMARYMSENGGPEGCEVRLVFLGSEENGYHGAHAYVRGLSETDWARHTAAFNMDVSIASPSDNAQLVMNMLGGKNKDGVCVDAAYLPVLSNIVTEHVSEAYMELYGMQPGAIFYHGESDHLPFQEGGLEAANVCWRRIVDNRPVMPSNYHTMDDTTEGLDYSTAVTSARCVLRAIDLIMEDF